MYRKEDFREYYYIIAGLFYLGQGYSLGSLALLLPIYIKDILGKTYTTAVVTSAIIIIPWYFKFIFGFMTDYYPIGRWGRRKPYLIIATVFSAIGWLTIDKHSELNIAFFVSGLFLAVGSALSDTVIDGQIVEITPTSKAANTQGVAWAGRGLGIGLAASIAPQLIVFYSWSFMFIVSSIFGISISILVLILPQISVELHKEDNYLRNKLLEVKSIFKNKDYQFKNRFLFVLSSGAAIAIVPQISIIMDKEFKFSYSLIGIGSMTFAIGTLVGSLIQGYLHNYYLEEKVFKIYNNLIKIVYLSGIALIFISNFYLNLLYLFFIGFSTGGFEAYQLAYIQKSSSEHHESTIFSIYTSISNVGQFLIGGWLLVAISEILLIPLFVPILLLLIPSFIAQKYQ